MFNEAVRTVLVAKREGNQKPMCYTSKVLQGLKKWYQKIEKLTYIIVLMFKRMKHYFQAHPIVI